MDDRPVLLEAAEGDNSLTVSLPDKLKTGRYYLTLLAQGEKSAETVPGELRVEPAAVTLESAHPTTAYWDSKVNGFSFDLIGDNFSADVTQDDVEIIGQGSIVKGRDPKGQCDTPGQELPCLWVEAQPSQTIARKMHIVGYPPKRYQQWYQGPMSVKVRVSGTESGEKKLVLARMSETAVLIWTVAIFGILCFVIFRLVTGGVRDYEVHGKHYSPLRSFLLDKETNSYSLSKFQFFAFSLVFVFGYLYVMLCRWMVQWQFTLPDVPSNLAGMLAISAGTTIVAIGATSSRGSKGAGPVQPSSADFISVGGLVVPERFQFFVWTLVACIGFIALLISQDPATLNEFPTFPSGLLYVMGVSAGGYLGGKVTRKPGPVIKSIALVKNEATANKPKGDPVIVIQGENLSLGADYLIDGKKLPIVTKDPDQPAGDKSDNDTLKLVTGVQQDQSADPKFCSELKITIKDQAQVNLMKGDHTFRILNPDGQFSETPFTADAPKIDSVTADGGDAVNHGGAAVVLLVGGSGFRPGMAAKWTAVNKEPADLSASAVQYVDDKNVKVTLIPGEAGTGVLMLTTPKGVAVTKSVEVK
ncbi:MAG: hypothetical protein M3O35_01465 [Acidobacteriota bacterium]|nr:hypothetical protein [Acidobacteriota bacterium]